MSKVIPVGKYFYLPEIHKSFTFRKMLDFNSLSTMLFQKYCDIPAEKIGVWFFDGLEPKDVWLRYCGTAGKPAANGENKHQPKYREKPVYLT